MFFFLLSLKYPHIKAADDEEEDDDLEKKSWLHIPFSPRYPRRLIVLLYENRRDFFLLKDVWCLYVCKLFSFGFFLVETLVPKPGTKICVRVLPYECADGTGAR